jgi:hypothetical protein
MYRFRRFLIMMLVLMGTLAFQSQKLHAEEACPCPWQVRQGTSTSSDCALATQNAQRNASAWATFECGYINSTVCGPVYWYDQGCTADPSGIGGTDSYFIVFKCNAC